LGLISVPPARPRWAVCLANVRGPRAQLRRDSVKEIDMTFVRRVMCSGFD